MSEIPDFLRSFETKTVTVIRNEGTDSEERLEIEGHIQSDAGFFGVSAPIYAGDTIVVPDPRGGVDRRLAEKVDVNDFGPAHMQHLHVHFGAAPTPRVAALRRIGIEGLHPGVVAVASDLYVDGHYSQAIFEALKALELRVRTQSGLDRSGRDLMAAAFGGDEPPIDLSVETGQSGRDEQEGLRFLFMGAIQGIRNPKGHENVKQEDPQRTLEYLAMVSVMFRRLDDAAETA